MKCYSATFKAMGGPCEFQAYSHSEPCFDEWLALVMAEVQRIEKKYSVFIENSVVSQINRAAGEHSVTIDEETYQLLKYGQLLWQTSAGKFDISAAPLIKLWDFQQALIPQQQALQRTLEWVGFEKTTLTKKSFYLHNKNMQINLGGFGKEYAVDRVIAQLCAHDCRHALVNLAGDVAVTGSQVDGSGWRIGIQHPRQLHTAMSGVHLKSGSVATSGDYERFFEKDGQRYCHIINAKTGWPAQGYASISVLAPSCLVAGSLATLALLEEQNASAWLSADAVGFNTTAVNCLGIATKNKQALAIEEKGNNLNYKAPALLIDSAMRMCWLNQSESPQNK